MNRGWMTINSRCGPLHLRIVDIALQDGRIIFKGSADLHGDSYSTDEESRCVITGNDDRIIGVFPYHGEQIVGANHWVTVTLPVQIMETR